MPKRKYKYVENVKTGLVGQIIDSSQSLIYVRWYDGTAHGATFGHPRDKVHTYLPKNCVPITKSEYEELKLAILQHQQEIQTMAEAANFDALKNTVRAKLKGKELDYLKATAKKVGATVKAKYPNDGMAKMQIANGIVNRIVVMVRDEKVKQQAALANLK